MPPRIPTEADLAPLAATLPLALHFPTPRESTTALLILLHGLGDSEAPFAAFARSLALPGVLAIAVRGPARLAPALLPAAAGFHWGDDVRLDARAGGLDPDPGFERAARLVADALVADVLVARCGWDPADVLLFGFGQGGSLALGLAARLGRRAGDGGAFKGVVSIGGPLPPSMVPTESARQKSATSVLVCQLDEDQVDAVGAEFKDVTAVRWKRSDVAMPRDREEAYPIIKFFADRLNSGWQA